MVWIAETVSTAVPVFEMTILRCGPAGVTGAPPTAIPPKSSEVTLVESAAWAKLPSETNRIKSVMVSARMGNLSVVYYHTTPGSV